MRRIRVVFALLAVLLWVPMGLLVHNALRSVELEREVRQQALAERFFDELERQLQELERREAERPFAEYDFYLRAPERGAVSPLAAAPAEPYVAGYFEIDPDGGVHSPRIPRERARAVARGDWRESSDLERAFGALRETALRGVEPLHAETDELAEQERQRPGTTRKSVPAKLGKDVARALDSDSYQQAFRSLNRAVEPKGKREERTGAFEPAAPAPTSAEPALGTVVSEGAFADAAPREAAPGRVAPGIRIEPMVGRWVAGDALVLHRTAIRSGRLYRQGLVVDVNALTAWLRDEVLGGSPLESRAALRFERAASPEGTRPSQADEHADYTYRHRFSAPFDALTATLSIPVLADVRGASYLYATSALLVVVGTLGLLAVYRMVAVAVAFAERRSDFVAAVTHELKTPLTAIRMYGEMLRDGIVPSEEKRHEYYSTITAESERLTRLINNVLEFSRLEQGTREMSLVAGAIGPVVEEAARLLEPHARDQGFAIEVELAPDLPAVRFDRDALLQVVFNLVDNALKYARDADDRVITLQCAESGGGVALSVRDRGPGVAARHLSKIFEPFYRGERELTRRAKGTGIGLALVKGLAERMGAAVSGRNAADGGFEVRLQFRPA